MATNFSKALYFHDGADEAIQLGGKGAGILENERGTRLYVFFFFQLSFVILGNFVRHLGVRVQNEAAVAEITLLHIRFNFMDGHEQILQRVLST